MAIAVQSVADGGWASSTDPNVAITITKPTGLTEGDLMVAVLFSDGETATPGTGETMTATGWTNESNTTYNAGGIIWFLYKTATASDVSASNFTFTSNFDGTGDQKIGGCILRIDGQAEETLEQSTGGFTNNATDTAISVGGLSLTPSYPDSLLIIALAGLNTEGGGSSISGYAIDSPNPSWTERIDISSATGNDSVLGVATTNINTTPQITTLSGTIDTTQQDDHYAAILVIPPLVNASVTLDALTMGAAMQAPSPTGDANVTIDSLSIGAAVQEPDMTQATPKWPNKDKSSNASFTNKTKS